MNHGDFSLKPFSGEAPRFSLKITGAIARRGPSLALHYELRGNLAAVALPEPGDQPARRPGLWEETCCEFFLAPQNSPGYWEFNLSPAGHWNVYGFQGYRQGMQEEPAFASLPFDVQSRGDSWRLILEVDLARIIPADQALEAAICAVIKGKNGGLTYWALSHPGPQADFHRRDSFIIEL
jgi:hypothetical protein